MRVGRQVVAFPGVSLYGPASRAGRVTIMLRRHWLLAVLLGAGGVLRILVVIAYRPALLYTDSLKYLYDAWPGTDPVGYKVPLELILLVGNLTTVVAVQHVLGLAMAVTLYAMMTRRGTPRWLAACAVAPVLLDAYQLEIEQTILPDVWFEALIVAGLAVLLRPPRPTLWATLAAGFLLGATVTVREIGLVLIVPALIYVVVAAGGWRSASGLGAALAAAFVAPVIIYGSVSYLANGHFRLSRAATSQAYGRAALAADCTSLRMAPQERPLCPSARQKMLLGTDGLDHAPVSPLVTYVPPPGVSKSVVVAGFVSAVLRQQPLNVLGGTAGDAVKLFALSRNTHPGDPPVSRWQFQAGYPTHAMRTATNHVLRFVEVSRDGHIVVGLNKSGATGGPYTYQRLSPALGGKAAVNPALATFLRSYQLRGGYTPGPLYAFAAVAGLLGLLGLSRRSTGGDQWELASACLLMFTTAVVLLLASDFFEFSWRYQLPAVVTLPPAGALGIAVITDRLRDSSGVLSRRAHRPGEG